MDLKFERFFDDKDFSVWRVGLWQFTRTIDGEAFWELVVWFDGPDGACPACQAKKEWLDMTADME